MLRPVARDVPFLNWSFSISMLRGTSAGLEEGGEGQKEEERGGGRTTKRMTMRRRNKDRKKETKKEKEERAKEGKSRQLVWGERKK